MSFTLKNGTASRTLGVSEPSSSMATSKSVLPSAAIFYPRNSANVSPCIPIFLKRRSPCALEKGFRFGRTVVSESNTDFLCSLRFKPRRQAPQQFGRDSAPPKVRRDKKILHLSFATMPCGPMSRDICNHCVFVQGNIRDSWQQRLPRVMLVIQVTRDTRICRIGGAMTCHHREYISGSRFPELNL